MKNTYKTLIREQKGGDGLRDLDADRKVILK
jgi:hypothetical protein